MTVEYKPKDFVSEVDPLLYSKAPWNKFVAIITMILGQKLYDYQCEILRAIAFHPRVAVVASRQIGKSVTIAFLAIAWALHKPNQTILIISTGERQVKELLTKRNFSIKKIFRRSGEDNMIYAPDPKNLDPRDVISAVGKVAGMDMKFQIPKEYRKRGDEPGLAINFDIKRENAEEIEFNNGSRIVVVPANPDTASGFTADLLIGDEIAKMPNWIDMWAAVLPFITRTEGHVALFSSYKGKNHWWDITQDIRTDENPHGWTVLKYNILVNPPKNLDLIKHNLPEAVYNEEYMCVPVDEYHTMFPFSLIDQCSTNSFDEWF